MDNIYFIGYGLTILSMIGWFFVKSVIMPVVTIFLALGVVYIGGTQQHLLTFSAEFFNMGLGVIMIISVATGVQRVTKGV